MLVVSDLARDFGAHTLTPDAISFAPFTVESTALDCGRVAPGGSGAAMTLLRPVLAGLQAHNPVQAMDELALRLTVQVRNDTSGGRFSVTVESPVGPSGVDVDEVFDPMQPPIEMEVDGWALALPLRAAAEAQPGGPAPGPLSPVLDPAPGTGEVLPARGRFVQIVTPAIRLVPTKKEFVLAPDDRGYLLVVSYRGGPQAGTVDTADIVLSAHGHQVTLRVTGQTVGIVVHPGSLAGPLYTGGVQDLQLPTDVPAGFGVSARFNYTVSGPANSLIPISGESRLLGGTGSSVMAKVRARHDAPAGTVTARVDWSVAGPGGHTHSGQLKMPVTIQHRVVEVERQLIPAATPTGEPLLTVTAGGAMQLYLWIRSSGPKHRLDFSAPGLPAGMTLRHTSAIAWGDGHWYSVRLDIDVAPSVPATPPGTQGTFTLSCTDEWGRTVASGLLFAYTLDRFVMQQQVQVTWCWAAVTASVSNYFGVTRTQCQVAERFFDLAAGACCVPSTVPFDHAACEPHSAGEALDAALGEFGLLANMTGQLTEAALQAELDAGRPVGIRYEWWNLTTSSWAGGHFLVVSGYVPLPTGTLYVLEDPGNGGQIFIEHAAIAFTAARHRWTHSYLLSAPK